MKNRGGMKIVEGLLNAWVKQCQGNRNGYSLLTKMGALSGGLSGCRPAGLGLKAFGDARFQVKDLKNHGQATDTIKWVFLEPKPELHELEPKSHSAPCLK